MAYRCPYCEHDFPDRKALEKHAREEHGMSLGSFYITAKTLQDELDDISESVNKTIDEIKKLGKKGL